jgi:hypothetical protein
VKRIIVLITAAILSLGTFTATAVAQTLHHAKVPTVEYRWLIHHPKYFGKVRIRHDPIIDGSCGAIGLTNSPPGHPLLVHSEGVSNQVDIFQLPITIWCFEAGPGYWHIHHRVNGSSSNEVLQGTSGGKVTLQPLVQGQDNQKWTFDSNAHRGDWKNLANLTNGPIVYANGNPGDLVNLEFTTDHYTNWTYGCIYGC